MWAGLTDRKVPELDRTRVRLRAKEISSLRTPACRCRILNHSYRPISRNEHLVRNSPDISFANRINPVHGSKQLPPIPIQRLILRQLRCQPFVAIQPANQVRLGPRLHHLELVITDVFFLKPLNLGVNGVAHFFILVTRHRRRKKIKNVRILHSGKSRTTLCHRSDLLIADQGAIQPRSPTLG